jgi:hypothetical protein
MRKFELQLFAGGSTSTRGGSTTDSSSHTEGGSSTSSHTEGGSHTHGESDTNSEGGSHSYSYGKSWLSGEVEENTKTHRNAYNTDYEEGQKVKDAYQRLQDTIDQKPTFQSKYEDKLNTLYDQIMNREKFNYNFNEDQMYQMYKDKYTQQGKQAMEDTLGKAQAMNGGYGSSYAQSAGQQTYQGYLQELNNAIPTLRDMAYEQYLNEGNEMLNKYSITSDAYNREYGQYRDDVSDWQADRSFNYGMYSDERNFDYNQFAQERNYWNDEYWKERSAETSNYQITDTNWWEHSHTSSDSDTNYWEDSQSNTNYWSDTSSHSATNSWSDSVSTPSGGGGGGKSSASSKAAQSANAAWGGGGSTNASQQKAWTDWMHQAPKQDTSSLSIAPYNQERVSNLVDMSKEDRQVAVQAISDLKNAQTASQQALTSYKLQQAGFTKEEIEILKEYAEGKRKFN